LTNDDPPYHVIPVHKRHAFLVGHCSGSDCQWHKLNEVEVRVFPTFDSMVEFCERGIDVLRTYPNIFEVVVEFGNPELSKRVQRAMEVHHILTVLPERARSWSE
jgi:hypothetical protein